MSYGEYGDDSHSCLACSRMATETGYCDRCWENKQDWLAEERYQREKAAELKSKSAESEVGP